MGTENSAQGRFSRHDTQRTGTLADFFNYNINGTLLTFFANVWKSKPRGDCQYGQPLLGEHFNNFLQGFIDLSVIIESRVIVYGPAAAFHVYHIQDEKNPSAGQFVRI